MVQPDATVYVVDDEAAARSAIESLMQSVGLRIETFASAADFLQSGIVQNRKADGPGCLVLDVRLPGMSGIELQRALTLAGVNIPIIFITGHGDIPMSVEAMKAGALEFLTKPFRGQELLDAIHNALERNRATREDEARHAELRRRLETLTPRERQVMQLVITGLLNKQIGAELGASERTIKIHRAQVMRKMGADSLPDLVRMAQKTGL
jgi:FixJ family two-component response regulator